MTNFALFAAGIAAAHVAGTRRQTLKRHRLMNGVSVKHQVLGRKVYNDKGDVVGKIEDLVLTKRVITHAIVGVGGFLRLGIYDVAVPVGKFVVNNDQIVLPGATKESVRGMPYVEHAQMAVD